MSEAIRRFFFVLILGPVCLFFAIGCGALFPLLALIGSLLDGPVEGFTGAWEMCFFENPGIEMFMEGWK